MREIGVKGRWAGKPLIFAVCFLGFLTSAFGQCFVRLQNSSSTLISLSVPGQPGWPPPGEVLFALLTAPVGTTDFTQFKPTGVLATNLSVAGRVLGGTVTVPGWPIGETRAFVIVGWFASLGTNFNPAWVHQGCNIGVGWSATGNWQSSSFQALNPFTVLGSSFTISGPISPMLCPHISQPPVSQTVTQGITVTFSVAASGGYPYPDPPWIPNYSWFFNDIELNAETNSVLVLANVQPTQAGAYYVTVRNPFPTYAAVSSAIATLEVYPRPVVAPTMTALPRSQTAEIGDKVHLGVRAIGDPPLTYRWVWNETNTVSHGDDPELTIMNIQAAQSGVYTVVVTNIGGAATSAPAMLGVIPVVPRRLVPCVVLNAVSSALLNVEYTSVLGVATDWTAFPTIFFTNSPQYFFDLTSPLPAQRFYRASQVAPVAVRPSLGLQFIPALTLIGSSGSQIHVDGINQFGPIDAWFTLATVTLTNTSQLYFDVTAPGQPQRLYRLAPVP